jgi:hypothetical protein
MKATAAALCAGAVSVETIADVEVVLRLYAVPLLHEVEGNGRRLPISDRLAGVRDAELSGKSERRELFGGIEVAEHDLLDACLSHKSHEPDRLWTGAIADNDARNQRTS